MQKLVSNTFFYQQKSYFLLKIILLVALNFTVLNVFSQVSSLTYKPGVNLNYSYAFINDDNTFLSYEGPFSLINDDITVTQSAVNSISLNSTHSVFFSAWLVHAELGSRYNSSKRDITIENINPGTRYSLGLNHQTVDFHFMLSVSRLFNIGEYSFFSLGSGAEITTVVSLFGDFAGKQFEGEGNTLYQYEVVDKELNRGVNFSPFVGFDFIFPVGNQYIKTGLSYFLFPPIKYNTGLEIKDQNNLTSVVNYETNREAGYLKLAFTLLFGKIDN